MCINKVILFDLANTVAGGKGIENQNKDRCTQEIPCCILLFHCDLAQKNKEGDH